LLRQYRSRSVNDGEPSVDEKYPDQSPIAALGLHWFSSVFLIAVTAGLDPKTSYTFLISLYAYVINGIMGCIAAGGLLHLKYFSKRMWPSTISQFSLGRSRRWKNSLPAWIHWINSVPAWIYFLFTGFLLIASFVPPGTGDANYSASRASIPWYIVPAIGLSTLLWGLVWYGGLKVVEWQWGETLEVVREPTIEEFKWPNGESEWVLISEVIRQNWTIRGHRPDEYEVD
jgi:Amino acid permease